MILREIDSPVIFFRSESDRRFLLIIKADINSAANERSRTGNLYCMKKEKTINPRLQRIASDNILSRFPPVITDHYDNVPF